MRTPYRFNCNAIRVVLILTLALLPGALEAQEPDGLTLQVTPAVSFPMGDSSEGFDIGYGADLSGSKSLAEGPLYLGGSLGYRYNPTVANTALSLISADAQFGLSVRPLSFLELSLGALAGAYGGVYEGSFGANPHGAALARAGFTFSESFQLGLGARYDYYLTRSDNGQMGSLYEGVSATLGATFTPGANRTVRELTPHFDIQQPSLQPVFPVFFKYYDANSLGTVSITNEEQGEVEDISVSFYVSQYMDSPKVSREIDGLDANETADVPLYALFQDDILGITEATSVNARIKVEYTYQGERLSETRSETLRVYDRNAITWDDDKKAASFVTAKDPTVLRLARSTAVAVRSSGGESVSKNIGMAMGLFDALHLYGMSYVIDPRSSYAELSQSANQIDYVQFPQQTLEFRSGDCDDLSILYAALLESVGIETAFITTPGHIYMAFALDMSMEQAQNAFAKQEDIIYQNGKAWVPVETTLIEEDFLQAWATGGKQWREARRTDTEGFFPVHDAWNAYEPTGFASRALNLDFPDTDDIATRYRQTRSAFGEREITPQVARLTERIAESGSVRLMNRLGTVYARHGMYDKAMAQFRRALEKESYVPALLNAGHVHYLAEELQEALEYYRRAAEAEPENANARISLARAQFELEQYGPAQENYRVAQNIRPEIAENYSYIVSESSSTARASAAAVRDLIEWNEE